ncbi:uncharacterized protein [Haliotis asinina]|uniref:uncharacterized protein n=1 Tax=Haliotis asinina TaxID=109174 RepID=UPI00353218F6
MCSKVKYGLYIFGLLIKSTAVDCSCTQCKDHHLSEFDGKAVTDCQLATFSQVEIAGFCSRRCSEDHRCRSYRYNSRTKTCSTYGCGYSRPTQTLSPVSADDGSRLYAFCENPSFGMKCETSSNCAFGNSTCVDGVCGCMTGTSYDVTTGDCLIRCSAYGSESTTYKDSGIEYCNINVLTTSTKKACIAACEAESGFKCISAEYYHGDGECNLCDTPALELPKGSLESGTASNWTLTVRHCAY